MRRGRGRCAHAAPCATGTALQRPCCGVDCCGAGPGGSGPEVAHGAAGSSQRGAARRSRCQVSTGPRGSSDDARGADTKGAHGGPARAARRAARRHQQRLETPTRRAAAGRGCCTGRDRRRRAGARARDAVCRSHLALAAAEGLRADDDDTGANRHARGEAPARARLLTAGFRAPGAHARVASLRRGCCCARGRPCLRPSAPSPASTPSSRTSRTRAAPRRSSESVWCRSCSSAARAACSPLTARRARPTSRCTRCGVPVACSRMRVRVLLCARAVSASG